MLFSLFQEIGFNEKDTEALLDTHATFKFMPIESIRKRIHSLQSVGVGGLSRLTVKCPDVLTSQEIKALLFLVGLQRKVKLLFQYGIPQEKLVHVLKIVNLTKALCFESSEEMERMLHFLNRFSGCEQEEQIASQNRFSYAVWVEFAGRIYIPDQGTLYLRTRELAMAMGVVTRTSCKNLHWNIGVFLNYGLTCEDILEVSKKYPQVLQYNHDSLEEKMDYLIEEMGGEVRKLLSFPAFLGKHRQCLPSGSVYHTIRLMDIGMPLCELNIQLRLECTLDSWAT
ncbi:transcription termination factor MTERF8, chloroplastic-like [Olea europaea var. sylvestris]|uniref:transcription termination factor MTERF8, chloroplastic-like n=1 Tax=Olea europaea var. sylvestris TaxID=158386 RepID=UPI000C1D0D81|nr:transcription termination factor MTERF8, chloroplastic-like [Olea europaea var. sylvestris]